MSWRRLIGIGAWVACVGCGGSSAVPEGIVGTWETETPPYANRFFEITRDSVRFGQGGDSVASHAIARLEAREEADRTLYELRYDNDGKRYTFTFYREPSGTITFRHQAGISWSRTR